MNIEKLLEITQALEISVDEFYKEEQVKLEELKNMPYSVAKESYASTKKIIDNKDLTYTLIGDLKSKLDEVKELDESRSLSMEEKQDEEIEDYEPDSPHFVRRINVRPKLRRFLLSDSSIVRLYENAKIDEVPVIQDPLEEIVSGEQIDEDMDQIMRIRKELLAEKKSYIPKPSIPEIEVQPSIDFSIKDEVEEEESSSSDGYFGFIDATAVLDSVDVDSAPVEEIEEESQIEEERIDLDRILYIEKPNYSSKIRAIGLPDRQLMDIINSRSEEEEAIAVLNDKCKDPISEPIRKEKIILKESTDIFTNSFDEDFQKALDIEPKRRIDKAKITEREKALKDLAQMD